jgi:hypothetical protein
VKTAYDFLKRFLADELETLIKDVLPVRYRTVIEDVAVGAPASEIPETFGTAASAEPLEMPSDIKAPLAEARAAEAVSSKIVSGYSVLRRAVINLAPSNRENERVYFKRTLRDAAKARGAPEKKLEGAVQFVLALRGRVLNSEYESTEKEGEAYLQTVERILNWVGFKVNNSN